MITESRSFSVFTSINKMLWALTPLLVTATYFLEWLTAIFKGKSPKLKDFPAGLNFHPLGRETIGAIFCAETLKIVPKSKQSK
jgi:hypothetical protein